MKKEYLILVIVIAGLCAYLFFKPGDRNHYSLPVLDELSSSDVTAVDIDKGGETILLKKTGDTWGVTEKNYPVDSQKINAVLSAVQALKLTALVSETGDLKRYELDPEKRLQVSVRAGDRPIREFDVGKTAPTYRHTFVRIAGDDRVFHAAGSFRADLDQTVDGFRDKRIISVNTDIIKGIRLEKDGVIRDFSREGKKGDTGSDTEAAAWVSADGPPPDADAIKRLVAILSSLKCSSYSATESKEEFLAEEPLVRVVLQAETTIELNLYSKAGDGPYPGISSENAYPFELDSYQGGDIVSKADTLLGLQKPEAGKEP